MYCDRNKEKNLIQVRKKPAIPQIFFKKGFISAHVNPRSGSMGEGGGAVY
jgi:hypothetical protein